jgi:hypothetical protein
MLYITERYHHLSNVENPWLRWLILHQCECVQFSCQGQLVNVMLLNVVTKLGKNMFYLLLDVMS